MPANGKNFDSAAKFPGNRWWWVAFSAAVIAGLAAVLAWLWRPEDDLYGNSGKIAEERMLYFCRSHPPGIDFIVWIPVYRADNMLLVDREHPNGNEYRYLTGECAAEVAKRLSRASARFVLFWLKSNYEVVAAYELGELDYIEGIELRNNYFPVAKTKVGFTFKKEEKLENRVRREVITIR